MQNEIGQSKPPHTLPERGLWFAGSFVSRRCCPSCLMSCWNLPSGQRRPTFGGQKPVMGGLRVQLPLYGPDSPQEAWIRSWGHTSGAEPPPEVSDPNILLLFCFLLGVICGFRLRDPPPEASETKLCAPNPPPEGSDLKLCGGSQAFRRRIRHQKFRIRNFVRANNGGEPPLAGGGSNTFGCGAAASGADPPP